MHVQCFRVVDVCLNIGLAALTRLVFHEIKVPAKRVLYTTLAADVCSSLRYDVDARPPGSNVTNS